jgi:hypothetical protein
MPFSQFVDAGDLVIVDAGEGVSEMGIFSAAIKGMTQRRSASVKIGAACMARLIDRL